MICEPLAFVLNPPGLDSAPAAALQSVRKGAERCCAGQQVGVFRLPKLVIPRAKRGPSGWMIQEVRSLGWGRGLGG